MQNSDEILADLQEWRNTLDQLNQTVQFFHDSENNDKFDHLTKTNMMADVINAINLTFDIEQQMMSTVLGFSYTKPKYNPSGNTYYGSTLTGYLIKQPANQFRQLRQVQAFYTNALALMKPRVIRAHATIKFRYNGLGQGTNQVVAPDTNPKPVGNTPATYDKTVTWQTKETLLAEAIQTINGVLMGDIPNVS